MEQKTKQDLINCVNMLFTFMIIAQDTAVELIKEIEAKN
jgi:hypothetical protein